MLTISDKVKQCNVLTIFYENSIFTQGWFKNNNAMCKLSLVKNNIIASFLLTLIKQKKGNVLIIFVNSNNAACYILSCNNDAIYS